LNACGFTPYRRHIPFGTHGGTTTGANELSLHLGVRAGNIEAIMSEVDRLSVAIAKLREIIRLDLLAMREVGLPPSQRRIMQSRVDENLFEIVELLVRIDSLDHVRSNPPWNKGLGQFLTP
jgi:hypothetical protein